jgi:hypothetical protein
MFAEAVKSHSKALHELEKIVINMIQHYCSLFLIGPGGLLLVVPTYICSFMGGVAKQ